MHEAKIVVTQYLKNRKGIKKLAKEINFYKGKSAKIELNFAGATVLNSDFIFLFKRVHLSYQEFKEIVTVTDFDPLTVFDIAHEILNRSRINYKRIGILLLILISVGFGINFSIISAISYIKIISIKSKIYYLIDKYEAYKDLTYYYNQKNIQISNQNRTLDQTIDSLAYNIVINCKKFSIPENLLTSLIYSESNFKKFAMSNIPIKDKKGKIIYYEHALGFTQIYLKVWEEAISANVDIMFDEYYSTYWSAWILSSLYKKNNSWQKTLINYNGGYKENIDNKTIINTDTYIYVQRIIDDMISINGIIYYNPKTKYLLK